MAARASPHAVLIALSFSSAFSRSLRSGPYPLRSVSWPPRCASWAEAPHRAGELGPVPRKADQFGQVRQTIQSLLLLAAPPPAAPAPSDALDEALDQMIVPPSRVRPE